MKRIFFSWWGGIGCRVSFYMTVALIMISALVGAFFFWEGKKALDAEIRARALYVSRELSAVAAEDILTGNRPELHRKISAPFAAQAESVAGDSLRYLMIYDRACGLIIAGTASEVFFDSDSYFYTVPSGTAPVRSDTALDCGSLRDAEPVFRVSRNGIHDLTLPVMIGSELVGFVRAGVSGQRFEQKFSGFMKKSAAALLGIILVGMAFSQIITLGITRPIHRLSEAAENLSQQNWDAPLPVQGTDEISRLGHTFNEMAQALRSREESLSRGNRDLFILHTSGLDLMESLALDDLVPKVLARAEDLVRADTVAITVVDRSNHMLKYLGVSGVKEEAVLLQDMPLEAGGIYNWMVSYGTPLLITDARSDFRLNGPLMTELGIRSIVAVPLWSANTMMGLLTALNKKGGEPFDRHDLRLLTVFSSLAGAALQNARLYRDLHEKMSELGSAQEQLVHSTKMAAIGELSANVAHEINNPLTSVLGYTSHLLKTLDLPAEPRRILGLMEQETLRVRKIIRNLLDFARQRPTRMQPGDILQPLHETIALVEGIADKHGVVVRERFPDGPLTVRMDHNEMKQVFINIVTNALQAMPEGGELLLTADAVGGQEVTVEVRDTGNGIAPEHLGKIFEPFFSTKESGDGTGLGLSISYRIVQNHGGRIEVESAPAQGSVFRVTLPRYSSALTSDTVGQSEGMII